ncbi:MAG: amidohydrolase family protein [Verrucomicrobia bacterium]|nr:amidohydrolase family protein [Verrucomicrobiota bacterium]
MASPSRLVDSHQHVRWHQRNEHDLVADLDAHGIEYAWLLTWNLGPAEQSPEHANYLNPALTLPDGSHPGIPLSDLLATRVQYPRRFVVGYCPHPAWPNAPALLEAAHRMHDVRICGEWKFRLHFDDPRCLAVFRMAGKLRLPVVLHLDVPWLPQPQTGERTFQPSWYGGTVERLERALQACPETVFVGHAPGFWRKISGDADRSADPYPASPVAPGGRLYRLFDTYPNLVADLSAGSGRNALARDPAHAVQFLTRYADRLLFGRDYYGQELHAFLQTLPLPADVTEKIYSQNAERLVAKPA